jgi:tetratricopeptide (TPR) repeat protein
MRQSYRFEMVGAGIVTCLLVLCLHAPNGSSQTASSSSGPEQPEVSWSQHVIQSYEQLQQQQLETLRAVEQARQDADAAAKRSAEALEARLNRIEQAVTAQREHELETMQNAHRFTLIVVGVFAGVGFIGMLIFALLLLRTMQRRAEAAPIQPTGIPLGQAYAAAGALGTGEAQLAQLNPAEQSSARFLNAVERPEKRIVELETTAQPAAAAPEPQAQPAENAEQSSGADRTGSETAARVALLLGKGQALLNLQQADSALECFDEAIKLDATNAEAFVRKGAALERLGRLDEAIDAYDRAIAADNAMTMAYLCKGGVFNRLERYGEALQCYEQALRAQQKARVS